MHYKNGNEAREGDPAICRPDKDRSYTLAGKLHTLKPGLISCNAQLAVPIVGGVNNMCVTVGDCYHAADAYEAMDALHGKPAAEKVA